MTSTDPGRGRIMRSARLAWVLAALVALSASGVAWVRVAKAETDAPAPDTQSADAPAVDADGMPGEEPTLDELAAKLDQSDRILGGIQVRPGQWPSMVALFMLKADGRAGPFCGGTVIARTWVLTAAHCAAAMKRERNTTFFIREGIVNLLGNTRRDVAVIRIVTHEKYVHKLTLNDVALLQLGSPAASPPQLLISGRQVEQTLAPQRVTTVIGFGLTSEKGQLSLDLLQVDVPVVSRQACRRTYGATRITDANFCAGTVQGGRDACQGDSGGPIFAPNVDGQQMQVGIVSWGRGCGRPGAPGVYASVGRFEDWIRSQVPEAQFTGTQAAVAAAPPPPPAPGSASAAAPPPRPVASGPVAAPPPPPATGAPVAAAPPPATSVALQAIAEGATTTEKPSQLAQLSVEIMQGNRVKAGEIVDIRVLSSVDGTLAVFNEEASRRAYQIFPTPAMTAAQPGGLDRIAAGAPLMLPPPRLKDGGFRFRITPPAGENRLVAVVIPPGAKVDDILSKHADGSDFYNLDHVLTELAEAMRGIEVVRLPPVHRAVATWNYTIVD